MWPNWVVTTLYFNSNRINPTWEGGGSLEQRWLYTFYRTKYEYTCACNSYSKMNIFVLQKKYSNIFNYSIKTYNSISYIVIYINKHLLWTFDILQGVIVCSLFIFQNYVCRENCVNRAEKCQICGGPMAWWGAGAQDCLDVGKGLHGPDGGLLNS